MRDYAAAIADVRKEWYMWEVCLKYGLQKRLLSTSHEVINPACANPRSRPPIPLKSEPIFSFLARPWPPSVRCSPIHLELLIERVRSEHVKPEQGCIAPSLPRKPSPNTGQIFEAICRRAWRVLTGGNEECRQRSAKVTGQIATAIFLS